MSEHTPDLLSAVEALFPEEQWDTWHDLQGDEDLCVTLYCKGKELLDLFNAIKKATGEATGEAREGTS